MLYMLCHDYNLVFFSFIKNLWFLPMYEISKISASVWIYWILFIKHQDWNSFFTTLSGMELCFPEDSPSKPSLVMKREVPQDDATTTILPDTNTTEEENVTLSVLADVQVERAGQTLFGVALHSSLPARHLGFSGE